MRNPHIRPSVFLNYAVGDYYIQDAGSMLALSLLKPQPKEVICDLCAAPGGKATGIVEQLGAGGFLLANEPIGGRCALLRYILSRTGSLRYAVTRQDPEVLAQRFAHRFDAVLVDAPCSGQTMVATTKRDENAFDMKQILHSAERQRRILKAAVRLLRPGGRLVYSTCTFAVEENEDQLRFLRETFSDAVETVVDDRLAAWESTNEPGCYRLWPHRDPTAGAFAFSVKLVKAVDGFSDSDDAKDTSLKDRTKGSRRSGALKFYDSACSKIDFSAEFGSFENTEMTAGIDREWYGIAADAPRSIRDQLSFSELTKLFSMRGESALPEHALALLDSEWFKPLEVVDLAGEFAAQVYAGEALAAKDRSSEAVSKWGVARWNARPVGWLKHAGNRYNNHLLRAALLPNIQWK